MSNRLNPRLIFTGHAIRQMFSRQITAQDVRDALSSGEVIVEYPQDRPYPSRLVLGYASGRPLHIVVAEDQVGAQLVVITVYEPDAALWQEDYRTRRKP